MKALLAATALAILWLAAPGRTGAQDLKQYKDLRNDYIRVIDVKELDRSEQKYVDVGGRLEYQNLPVKELRVTAEISKKPPSTMDNMFQDEKAVPFFKICLTAFKDQEKLGDEACKPFKFQAWVKGNIGAANFALPEGLTRYELRVIKNVPSKGESFKIWVPTD